MKKQIAIIIISSVIAMILCGCGGTGTEQSKNTAAVSGNAESSESKSAESSTSASSDDKKSSTASSKAESSAENSKKESSESSAAVSGESKAGTESSAAEKSSSERSGADTSVAESTQSEQTSQESDGVVYDEDGAVIETPSKYVSTMQKTIDVSDAELAKTGEDLNSFFFTAKKELDDFVKNNKDKYSLEKTDSGNTFSESTDTFDDTFFETMNVLVVVQSYDKDKGIEIGDTHIEAKGPILDIYKEQPRAPDKAAYVLTIISYKKKEVSKKPEINILPAGEMYTDESDPDVIVSLGDEDEDEEVENNVSVTEDGDIVYTN